MSVSTSRMPAASCWRWPGCCCRALTGVAPVLTPLTAVGLTVVMVLAAIAHAGLPEPRNVTVNLAVLTVCVFVAYGRFNLEW